MGGREALHHPDLQWGSLHMHWPCASEFLLGE